MKRLVAAVLAAALSGLLWAPAASASTVSPGCAAASFTDDGRHYVSRSIVNFTFNAGEVIEIDLIEYQGGSPGFDPTQLKVNDVEVDSGFVPDTLTWTVPTSEKYDEVKLTSIPGVRFTWRCTPPDADGDGVNDADDLCADTVLPDIFTNLHPQRYAAGADGVFSSAARRGTWTIADTGGCSGQQIIAAMGLGRSQQAKGISRTSLRSWIASIAGT